MLFGQNVSKVPELDDWHNHLFYVDDFKIYAKSSVGLKKAIEMVVRVSKSIGMELGLSKCGSAFIERGKLVNKAVTMSGVTSLPEGEKYSYLGREQVFGHNDCIGSREFFSTVESKARAVCRSSLNARNMTTAWNSVVVSGLRYFFASLAWPRSRIEREFEPKLRSILSEQGCHYRTDSVRERQHPTARHSSNALHAVRYARRPTGRRRSQPSLTN